MRRRLRAMLPALAHHFGVMPWHIDGGPQVLTFGEIDEFVRQVRALTKKPRG